MQNTDKFQQIWVNSKGYRTPATSKTKSFVTITINQKPLTFVTKNFIQDTAGSQNCILKHERKLLKNSINCSKLKYEI